MVINLSSPILIAHYGPMRGPFWKTEELEAWSPLIVDTAKFITRVFDKVTAQHRRSATRVLSITILMVSMTDESTTFFLPYLPFKNFNYYFSGAFESERKILKGFFFHVFVFAPLSTTDNREEQPHDPYQKRNNCSNDIKKILVPCF